MFLGFPHRPERFRRRARLDWLEPDSSYLHLELVNLKFLLFNMRCVRYVDVTEVSMKLRVKLEHAIRVSPCDDVF